MFLLTNSSCAKSRVILRQSEGTLMPRTPREQAKSPWRGMARLYLFYIKAEETLTPVLQGRTLSLPQREVDLALPIPLGPVQCPYYRQERFYLVPPAAPRRDRNSGARRPVQRALWSIQCLQAQAGQPTNPVPMNSSSGNNS